MMVGNGVPGRLCVCMRRSTCKQTLLGSLHPIVIWLGQRTSNELSNIPVFSGIFLSSENTGSGLSPGAHWTRLRGLGTPRAAVTRWTALANSGRHHCTISNSSSSKKANLFPSVYPIPLCNLVKQLQNLRDFWKIPARHKWNHVNQVIRMVLLVLFGRRGFRCTPF